MLHLEERLENDLTAIRSEIAHQAERVETAVSNAMQALQTGNRQLAYTTILNDYPVNRASREIDRLCHRFIAVHLPSGTHLRLLSAVIRVNIELERVGDYAVTIAREGVQLVSAPADGMGRELERMSSETLLMFKQATKAFNELNAELARSTMVMSGAMEYNLSSVYEEIADTVQVTDIKDKLALFVVFNQLKRVADQAKNLCENAVFAATGAQKSPKIFNLLFLDEDNSFKSQLAEAIAHKDYPDVAIFRSAGRDAAENLNPELVRFLSERGLHLADEKPKPITDLPPRDIANQDVIISLQGDIDRYLSEIPFHASVLHWNLEENSGDGDADQIEELYRALALQIKDLMDLLRGEED
ncbi:MAG: PhoU domain-containing protein [bacterium]